MTRGAGRILFVPTGSSRLAVTRVRILEHLPALAAAGFSWTIAPALSDSGSRRALASPRSRLFPRLAGYLLQLAERLVRFPWIAWLACQHDVVFLQRVSFPFGLNAILRFINPRIVFDFDDSIFMADPSSPDAGVLQRLKGFWRATEFRSAMRTASVVVAGNAYLADAARNHSTSVHVLTETIDTHRYRPRLWPEATSGPFVIGWIGSPSTIRFLDELRAVLQDLAARRPMILRLIGADMAIPGVAVESRSWSPETETTDLQTFDVGLMPMPRNAWTEGKFGSKMLQYMASGVPTIASDNATNRSVLIHGVTGFLARNPAAWAESLELLAGDYLLRREVGLAGRAEVERKHSLDQGDRQFVEIIRIAIDAPSARKFDRA